MSIPRRIKRWMDPDSPAQNPPPVPVQTTFRHMAASPAVATRVAAEAQKLQRYFDRISHCHVVIVAPHLHHRRGRCYSMHIELGVPGERLVIDHEPPALVRSDAADHVAKSIDGSATHKDIYVVIREAFDAARRRLEDYVRRLRGDVKRHVRDRAVVKELPEG